jgi:hypothetical protein
MPDRKTISVIAKILARAGSENPNEAKSSLEGAYKRMDRDGVSFEDLLSLPISDLYQDTLVKLVDVILADKPHFSPSAKRAAYAEYIRLIVIKFSGASDGYSDKSTESTQQSKSREEEAREYEARRQREEAARSRTGQSESSNQENNSQFNHQNSKTEKQENVFSWTIRRHTFSFSPEAFFAAMQPVWGRGSILWHTLHDPVSGFRLFAASFLWGVAFAVVILLIAGVGHAITGTRPLWDVTLKNLFSFLVIVGMFWKTRAFFLAGWFR